MTLTENDLRVLRAAIEATDAWDGYVPHGAVDHRAIGRLCRGGLVTRVGVGVCSECDSPTHRANPTEVPIYHPTDAGRAVAVETRPTCGHSLTTRYDHAARPCARERGHAGPHRSAR